MPGIECRLLQVFLCLCCQYVLGVRRDTSFTAGSWLEGRGLLLQPEREGGREGRREGGKERGREGEREGGREGGEFILRRL